MALGDKIKDLWRRSMKHRALLVAPPVVALLLVGFMTIGTRPKAEYYTRAVDVGPIEQVVQATGTINAVTTVQVGSQVSGNISQLFADFNSKVTKDQVVAQIDPSTFRARMLQADADLENARANVRSLEAQVETARADVQAAKATVDRAQAQRKEAELQLQRTKELTEEGILSAAQKDTAQSNYDQAAASVGVAQAQLQQSQARLKTTQAQLEQSRAQVSQRKAAAEMARVDLSHTTIKAPIDGTVIARNVDVGQTVAASLSAPTLFLIAQDLTKMLVYAKTDEADVGKIRIGARARFRVDSFPQRQFFGRVAQVRMNATTVQNVVTYDTIIEFENVNQVLFPGMTAYVTIPIEFVDEAVRIPNGALRFKPDLSDDERKELYAKYKIPEEQPAGAGRMGGGGKNFAAGQRSGAGGGQGGGTQGNAAAAGTPQSGAPGGSGEGRRSGAGGASAPGGDGAAGGGGDGRRRMMMAGGFGGSREQWGVVWKEGPGRELIPVRVKLGVTDFTFTEMREGEIKVGDKLVIGQSSGKGGSQPQQQARPGQQGPMGPGVPRRF